MHYLAAASVAESALSNWSIIFSWRIIIQFHRIYILGEQIVRSCIPFDLKEGCFDNESLRKEFEQAAQAAGEAGQAVGQAVEQGIGNIADAMDFNRQAVTIDGEGCICKKDLCNSSPVARTSSLMTIIFVVFFQILY